MAQRNIRLAGLLFLVILISLSCNLPGSGGESGPFVDVESPAEADTAAPIEEQHVFLEVTITPRPAAKIVVKEASMNEKGNLARVMLILPQELVGMEVYANDILIEDARLDGNRLNIDLEGKVAARVVTFFFKSGGEVQATCMINMDDPLSPGGDCDF